jgi:GH18 family chitinase
VNWEQATHVTFLAGRVSSDGSVDLSAGEINQRMDELVARGHIAGRAVLLGLAGRLSPVDGWALYEANDFGEAIRTPASRAALVTTVANYVTARKLDGVDIMMSDINSGAYAQNVAAIAPFISELKDALPAGSIITVTVGAGWQHWDYPSLAEATWVNVRAFEDGIHVGPGAPRGQASSYDYMLAAAKIWADFHLPADKLVIGIPAFGLRYNAIDDLGNNLDWGSYDYVPYKTILGFDPEAADKEQVDHAQGIYYNGRPLVKQKGDFIKTSAYKGAYLWAADYDSGDDNALLKELHNALK